MHRVSVPTRQLPDPEVAPAWHSPEKQPEATRSGPQRSVTGRATSKPASSHVGTPGGGDGEADGGCGLVAPTSSLSPLSGGSQAPHTSGNSSATRWHAAASRGRVPGGHRGQFVRRCAASAIQGGPQLRRFDGVGEAEDSIAVIVTPTWGHFVLERLPSCRRADAGSSSWTPLSRNASLHGVHSYRARSHVHVGR